MKYRKTKTPGRVNLSSILIDDWDPFMGAFSFGQRHDILYNPLLKESNLIDITGRYVLKEEDIKRVGNEI